MSGFIQRIEQLLDHRPQDVERAAAALTHPSYLHQHPDAGAHNQRLEFLGDAVLGLIVAEEMFRLLEGDEGKLTRARASVVSTAALAGAARRLMLGDLLRMSDAAQRSGDNQRDKVLADAFESMVALAYEELGLEGARAFVHAPVHKVVVLWGQEDAVFGEGAGLKAAQMDAAQAAMSTWFGETS